MCTALDGLRSKVYIYIILVCVKRKRTKKRRDGVKERSKEISIMKEGERASDWEGKRENKLS